MNTTLTYKYGWVIASGIAMGLAWPPLFATVLIFVAFVPLLLIEEEIAGQNVINTRKLFFLSFVQFFIWNVFTCWWIVNASIGGAVVGVLLNSLLMCLPILGYSLTKKRLQLGNYLAGLIFIAFWLSLEYLHYHWQLNWPWLNLGNVFANNTWAVQWYSLTGVGGGSTWILLVNYLAFVLIKSFNKEDKTILKHYMPVALSLLLPMATSLVIMNTYQPFSDAVKVQATEIAVIQPNIDPYTKHLEETYAQQISNMLNLMDKVLNEQTDIVLMPEAALPASVWMHKTTQHEALSKLKEKMQTFPNADLLTGALSVQYYEQDNATPTARNFLRSNGSYDVYNSLLFLRNNDSIQYHHKSKLVPAVEQIPYINYLPFLRPAFELLGGSSLATSPNPSIMEGKSGFKFAPLVCFESVFGGYTASLLRQGAGAILIGTNDGWWGDTFGYQQHFSYARLRAIENRCYVVRAANTGISGVINPLGTIEMATNWSETTAFQRRITASTNPTFYTLNGDVLYRIAALLSIIFLFFTFSARNRWRKRLNSPLVS